MRKLLESVSMEAIVEFDVKDMLVTLAVSADGTSVNATGPKELTCSSFFAPISSNCHAARTGETTCTAKPQSCPRAALPVPPAP